MTLLVTSKNCAPCAAAKRLLRQLEINYEEKEMDPSIASFIRLRAAGHVGVPTLIHNNEVYVGFSPTRYAEILKGGLWTN